MSRVLMRAADRRELAYLENLELQGKVVYDVGASIGRHSFLFRRLVGATGHVYSFEPDPAAHARLAQLVELNSLANLTVFPIALGNETGRVQLVVPNGSGALAAATLSPAFARSDGIGTQLDVPIARLDEWVEVHRLPDPALVKIDVEGFELQVLSGARELLLRARPLLFIEMHGIDREAKLKNAVDVVRLLADLGYTCTHLETGANVPIGRSEIAATGHLIGRASGEQQE